MDLRTRLNIQSDDGGVFTDFSAEAQDFKRDPFTITMTTDDFIYIGFNKQINAFYVQMDTENTITSTMKLEYFSPIGWIELDISDDTKALTRNGFVSWERIKADNDNPPEETIINGDTEIWVRMSIADNIDPVDFQAINIIFSDDNDMSQEVPALVDPCFFPTGQTSHILNHVASKNYIMGRLKNGEYVNNTEDGEENITEWDVLDIYELRQSSNYYAIAHVYFNLSDNVEDQYWAKYEEYSAKYKEAFALGRLRIDQNNDGQVNTDEKRPFKTLRWGR